MYKVIIPTETIIDEFLFTCNLVEDFEIDLEDLVESFLAFIVRGEDYNDALEDTADTLTSHLEDEDHRIAHDAIREFGEAVQDVVEECRLDEDLKAGLFTYDQLLGYDIVLDREED